jgi:hypothetical protein
VQLQVVNPTVGSRRKLKSFSEGKDKLLAAIVEDSWQEGESRSFG